MWKAPYLCLPFFILNLGVLPKCKVFVRIKESVWSKVRIEIMFNPILLLTMPTIFTRVISASASCLLNEGVSIRMCHFMLGFSYANFFAFYTVEVTIQRKISFIQQM